MKQLKIKKKEKSEIAYALSLITTLGINLIVIMCICFFLGKFIDDKFNTSPIFLFIFIILGMLSAMRNMYVVVMNSIKKSKK